MEADDSVLSEQAYSIAPVSRDRVCARPATHEDELTGSPFEGASQGIPDTPFSSSSRRHSDGRK